MSFLLKIRKKKPKEEKPKSTFEDSLRAKTKLNLLEKRYETMEGLVAGSDPDSELASSKVLKTQIVGTQGFGEIGDNNKPSNEALEGWQELLELTMLDELDYKQGGEETHKVNTTLVFGALANLSNRSLRREHTNVEIVTVPPELFMPSWLMRSERTSTLEK